MAASAMAANFIESQLLPIFFRWFLGIRLLDVRLFSPELRFVYRCHEPLPLA